ncbi:MAG: carbohydrate-binding protein [Opitutaceae bacterium]|nr:carbohydrate-binding protein [Opitutaceae bacterium]
MSLPTLCALACACLLPSALAAADNLIFNGGFELGTAGFEVNKNLRPDTNPTLVYEGAVLDASTKASGVQSLKIPNRYAEFMELYARGVVLKPNTTYTFSFSAKSDVDALSVSPLVVANDFNPAHGTTFTVGKTWKRYSFSFTTGVLRVPGAPASSEVTPKAIWIRTNLEGGESAGPANTLWFDDLQLIEGSSSVFGASAEIEVAATPSQDLYDSDDATISVRLVARNTTARALSGSLRLHLTEEDGAPPATVGAYELVLEPGERREIVHTMPRERFGCFTLTPVASFDATADVLPAWYSVVGNYVPQAAQVDLATTFCISSNNGLTSSYGPRGTIVARDASADHFLDLYAQMGGRMMRLWDGGYPLNWQTNEPVAQGQYDDAYSDLCIDRLWAHGIAPVPVLGGSWITPHTDPDTTWPAWLLAISPRAWAGQWFWGEGYQAFLPPDALWRTHIRRMAARYQGKITHWEVMNEPNIWMPVAPGQSTGATNYVPYLKSAAEELRAADAAVKIVGFCPTGDMGSTSTVPFLREGFAVGGLDSADVVSFHPYAAAHLGSSNPADSAIAAIRAETEKKRADVPLWNTEVYYLNEAGARGDSTFIRPRHVASRVLIDLGEGVAQSCSVADDALWRRTLNLGFRDATALSRWRPSANFVAYNTLARLFEGAKPVTGGKIVLSSAAICYVYERRDGTPAAAVWRYRPGGDPAISLPSTLGAMRVLDVFGNAETSSGGSVTVGENPQFLLPPAGTTTAAFVAALRSAAPPVVACTPVGVKNVGDKAALGAAVAVPSGRTITTVSFAADGVAIGDAIYNSTTGLWTLSYTTTKAGRIAITATATDSAGATRVGTATLVVGSLGTFGNNGQPWTVPAGGTLRIEAEHFDEGGPGAAYHDSDAMNGDCPLRSSGSLDEVDVRWSEDDLNEDETIKRRSSGPFVGSTGWGEWLRYTVKLPAAGRYTLRFGVSNSKDGGNSAGPHVIAKWNGTQVATATISPRTESWNDFQPFQTTTTVDLPAGTGVLELSFDSWGVALNWFEIGPAAVAGNNAPVFITTEPVSVTCAAGGIGTRQLAAADADGDTLRWSIASQPIYGTASVSATGLLTCVAPYNFGTGQYCVVRVEDGRGGAAAIRVDLTVSSVDGAPVATVNAPAGPLVAGAPILLTAAATDPDGVVASVKYFANGTAIGTGTNSSSGWGVVWTPAAAGSYALTCQPTDNKNKTGPLSASVTVKVVAAGTALLVTDECGTAAPPERVQVLRLSPGDASGIRPYGHTTRMIPSSGSVAGTVTWHVPDAKSVWFSYALTDGQPGAVTVEASSDGTAFAAVAMFGESVGWVSPWHIFDGAAAVLPAGTNFVRLAVDSIGAVHHWDSALLWVQIDSVAGGGSAMPVTLPANFKVSLVPVAGQGDQFQVVFGPVLVGWTYTPEYCTDLGAGNWLALSAYDETNNGPQRTITDLSASGARRFYRIRATPAP